MSGIGLPEVGWLLVLAVLLTPPEKIPDLARKAARVLHFVRGIANNATSQLKAELGPEYADLTLADLHPKTFVRKHLIDGLANDISDVRHEIEDLRADLQLEQQQINQVLHSDGSSTSVPELVGAVPFDPDAT